MKRQKGFRPNKRYQAKTKKQNWPGYLSPAEEKRLEKAQAISGTFMVLNNLSGEMFETRTMQRMFYSWLRATRQDRLWEKYTFTDQGPA